jgi:hypothetical protein
LRIPVVLVSGPYALGFVMFGDSFDIALVAAAAAGRAVLSSASVA